MKFAGMLFAALSLSLAAPTSQAEAAELFDDATSDLSLNFDLSAFLQPGHRITAVELLVNGVSFGDFGSSAYGAYGNYELVSTCLFFCSGSPSEYQYERTRLGTRTDSIQDSFDVSFAGKTLATLTTNYRTEFELGFPHKVHSFSHMGLVGGTYYSFWDVSRPFYRSQGYFGSVSQAISLSDPLIAAINLNKGIAFSVNPAAGGFDGISGRLSFNVAVVPEPATWAMMIAGFSLIGAAVRRRNRLAAALA